MSFKNSKSFDDLLQDCRRESEALQISDETSVSSAMKEPSPENETSAEDAHTDIEEKKESPITPQRKIIKQKTSTTKRGKHGRLFKTDPYGNLIRKKKKGAPLRKADPINTVTPADIQKPQVSFMNSIATFEPAARARWTGVQTSQAYDHAVLTEDSAQEGPYHPKIRHMADSTRAKELRRRRRKLTHTQPYVKDSPVEQIQSKPATKKHPSTEEDATKRIPDQFMERPRDPSEPVQYIRTAEHTQIDLSSTENAFLQDSEIDVHYPSERRVRFDLPKQEKELCDPDDKRSIQQELNELKTTLSLRAVMLGLLTVVSSLVMLFDHFGLPLPSFLSKSTAPVGYLTVQILFGLMGLLFSGDLIKTGYMKLLSFRADCDSLAAMSMISSELAAIMLLPSAGMLSNGIVSIYIPVALLSVFINVLSKNMIVSRALRNFTILSDDNPKYGIHYVEDDHRAELLTRGTMGDYPILATMQKVEHPKDFLKYTFSTDLGDKFCRIAVPVLLLIAVVFSMIATTLRTNLESTLCYGLSIFALCFSACACTAITLISNIPLAMGTKNYVRNSGLLLGYQSVDDFFDVNTVMIDAQTLFPIGTTTLESIQIIGENRIDEALQYSASLTQHAGSILKDLFASAILTEQQMLLDVENYAYDEGKGISGWIHNKRVLLGTREMMIDHNIEGLPAYSKEEELVHGGNEALYLSVSGTVSAMYIIRLEASKMVRRWLHELNREEIFVLIRSNDALLSQRRIAKMFDFPEHMLKILPARMEQDYAAETVPLQQGSPSMLCAGRLPGFAQTIVGAKRIRAAAAFGLILQAVTACLGLLFAIIFVLLGAYEDISGSILFIYHVICTLFTILFVKVRET